MGQWRDERDYKEIGEMEEWIVLLLNNGFNMNKYNSCCHWIRKLIRSLCK